MTINQFINVAVAEKLAASAHRALLRERAAHANQVDFLAPWQKAAEPRPRSLAMHGRRLAAFGRKAAVQRRRGHGTLVVQHGQIDG